MAAAFPGAGRAGGSDGKLVCKRAFGTRSLELPPHLATPSATSRGQDRHAMLSLAQVWGGEALLGVGRSARPSGNSCVQLGEGQVCSFPQKPVWGP